MNSHFLKNLCILFLVLASISSTNSQTYTQELYDALAYRLIGPFRGGRSTAVTGVPNKPNLYYFGATGGGIWKTEDGGRTWSNISDGFFGGSIGAIAVAKSDPNVIYVGGGEKTLYNRDCLKADISLEYPFIQPILILYMPLC